jgi:hypothetical protein
MTGEASWEPNSAQQDAADMSVAREFFGGCLWPNKDSGSRAMAGQRQPPTNCKTGFLTRRVALRAKVDFALPAKALKGPRVAELS